MPDQRVLVSSDARLILYFVFLYPGIFLSYLGLLAAPKLLSNVVSALTILVSKFPYLVVVVVVLPQGVVVSAVVVMVVVL